ncbi:VWA domain-containing protein [Polaromonas aquatica]|uniref:VWA domain-containing protein n=1 Tax=Polaromonas aquatica TaxID=332657 RepID=A0ABW1TWE0_9BURK
MNNVGKIASAQRVIAGLMSLILSRKCTVEWGQLAGCGENGAISLPRPKTGDADEIALLTRLAVHEAGHEKHTDFDCIEGLDGNVRALMNALEDPRIEREQVKTFPGAALVLNRGLEDSIRAVDANFDASNPEHSANLVTLNVLIKGYRKLVGHQGMKEAADCLVAKGDQILGEDGVTAVGQAIDRLAGCTNTAEAVALAKDLWQALQPPEPEQQSPQSSESQDQDDAADADDESQEKQDGAGAADKDTPKQPSEPEGSGEDESPPDSDGQAESTPPESSATGGDPPQGGSPQEDADGEPEPEGNGNDQNPENTGGAHGGTDDADGGAGEADGDNPEGSTPKEPGNESGSEDSSQSNGAGDQNGDGKPSAGAHNQESSEGGEGATAQESQKGEAGQGKPGQNGKLDLNSAMGTDLGTLLAQAYELKYGKPDVDAPGQAMAAQATTPTDDFTQMVATALERAADDGESLEKALELIEVALEAVSASGQGEGGEKEPESLVLAAGGGNATGTSNPFDASARLNGAVSRLVRIFTKELQDKRRRTVKLASAGGQVAANRAWRLKAMGDTNVFKVTSSVCGIDAAAAIMLDRSGSMSRCIVEAAGAALSCSQALERISKIKTSIEMFPGYAHSLQNTVTLQAFGQSARQVARKVNDVDAEGGTPLAEALMEVMPKLLAQRVKKRIVFLVTDGIPNNLAGALDEIEKAKKLGVEFVGIGIGEYGKAIEGLTPFSVWINDASELPDAFEKLFRGNIALKLAA